MQKDKLPSSEMKRSHLLQDALAAWNHYESTGLHISDEEAYCWLAKLEAGKCAAAPDCHL